MADNLINPKSFDPSISNVSLDSLENDIIEIKDQLKYLQQKRVIQSDILPGAVKSRHIEAWIIFSGLEADLPDGETNVKAYFCTDSFKLKLWTGSAWKSTTLA